LDSFDVYVWSVQTGQLLDQLAGHEGPVSTLAFAPNGGTVVSGSWDHTVRIWSIFGRTQTSEPLQLQSDVLCIAYRPDSKQVVVSTLDGQLTFWSVDEATQENGVNGRRDASGGRKLTDRRTAANAVGTKSFNTATYSADGTCVLAGGNSKYICLYDVQSGTLIKKFTVSINLSLDATQEFLNSRNLTEAGPASSWTIMATLRISKIGWTALYPARFGATVLGEVDQKFVCLLWLSPLLVALSVQHQRKAFSSTL
jgi:periodic tryptophan protein 2